VVQKCVSVRVLALLIGCVLGAGCSPRSEPSTGKAPRLTILYATCSLNRTYLSPYDPTVHTTPNLARLAERGVVFERHQTESGQSGTSFASIFTGLQADGHGIYHHPTRLRPELDLIAESFAAAGFETWSYLEHLMAGRALAYAQGVPPAHRRDHKLVGDDPDFVDLLQRLANDPDKRAFVVTNFTVTHAPYRGRDLDRFCERAPEACAVREHPRFRFLAGVYARRHIALSWDFDRVVAQLGLDAEQVSILEQIAELFYRADVAYLDGLLGELLDTLEASGLQDETLFVFTADHGEIRIRDNAAFRWTHGMQLAPEVLNVPLIVSAPGLGIVPGRHTGVTRSIDLFPTILALNGVPGPARPQSVDLAPSLLGRGEVEEPTAWSHTALLPPDFREKWSGFPRLYERFPTGDPGYMWVAARRADAFYELRREPGTMSFEPHRYDLASDPEKRTDVFDRERAEDVAMQSELERYRERLIAAYPGERAGTEDIDAEEQERRLRALGYIE